MTSKGTIERMLWSHYTTNNHCTSTTSPPTPSPPPTSTMMQLRRSVLSDHPIIVRVEHIALGTTKLYHGVNDYIDEDIAEPFWSQQRRYYNKFIKCALIVADSELSIPAMIERRRRVVKSSNKKQRKMPPMKDIHPNTLLCIHEFTPKISEIDGHYIIIKSFSIVRTIVTNPVESVINVPRLPSTNPEDLKVLIRKDLYLLYLSECVKHTENYSYYYDQLPNNNFGYGGASVIADLVRTNNSIKRNYHIRMLTVLNLEGNNLSNTGVQILVPAFRSCDSLSSVDFSNNNISYPGVKTLADYIEANPRLSELVLNKNRIGTRAIQALATALCINTRLEVLSLNDNNITGTMIVPFGMMLMNNTRLEDLSLDNNNIGDDGIIALASGLWKNKTLTELVVPSNNIGNTGISYLAHVLKYNTGLWEVHLQNNVFDDIGTLAMYKAMEYNSRITTLVWDPRFKRPTGLEDDPRRIVSLSDDEDEDDDEDIDDASERNDDGREYYDTSMTTIILTMLEEYNDNIDVILDPKLPRSIKDFLEERRDFECGTAPRKGQRQLMDIFQWLQYRWM